MSYLYDCYNVDRISIYVVKSPSQTSSPSRVETRERCVPYLNVAYRGHSEDDMDL